MIRPIAGGEDPVMDISTSTQKRLADELRLDRVARLLGRYPDIGTAEKAEIIRFIKKGPRREVALLISRDALKPKLDRFKADHRKDFSAGWKDLLMAALIVGAVVGACLLLWSVTASGG